MCTYIHMIIYMHAYTYVHVRALIIFLHMCVCVFHIYYARDCLTCVYICFCVCVHQGCPLFWLCKPYFIFSKINVHVFSNKISPFSQKSNVYLSNHTCPSFQPQNQTSTKLKSHLTVDLDNEPRTSEPQCRDQLLTEIRYFGTAVYDRSNSTKGPPRQKHLYEIRGGMIFKLRFETSIWCHCCNAVLVGLFCVFLPRRMSRVWNTKWAPTVPRSLCKRAEQYGCCFDRSDNSWSQFIVAAHSTITAFLSENRVLLWWSNKGTAEVYKDLFLEEPY